MSLTLFDHRNRRVVQTSAEEHACIPLGVHFTDCDSRRISDSCYDLLFTIDTTTAFPRIPRLPRKLPIIYQTRDPEFSVFAYRILDESTVSLLSTDETLDISQALNANRVALKGQEIPFNPKKAEDALAWAGVFSLKALSRREKKRAIAIVDGRWGEDWKPRCVVPWEDDASKSDMLDLEWVEPFGQNASFVCPDPQKRCDRGIFGKKTLPLVLYEQSTELNLFGSFNPQLIVTYCRRCRAIAIENQCD